MMLRATLSALLIRGSYIGGPCEREEALKLVAVQYGNGPIFFDTTCLTRWIVVRRGGRLVVLLYSERKALDGVRRTRFGCGGAIGSTSGASVGCAR